MRIIRLKTETKVPQKLKCERCGYIASNKLCKACILLEGLNKTKAKITLEMEEEEKNK